MKKNIFTFQVWQMQICVLLSGLFLAFSVHAQYPAGSPVAVNGQLSVAGGQLVNECGNPVQLRGMSTHGVQWFENCYNENSLDALVNDWGIDIFRIAMYVEDGGYVNNPSYWKNWIDNMVAECAERGIYCMIDWHVLHPGDPWANIDAARDFWSYMSAQHAGKEHVLYEIANEPNGVDWPRVKSYAEDIIPRIRANDPNTVVIVGTPNWSQDVDIASANPLDFNNIMYTLHFYSGTHTSNLRQKGNTALANGAALFVTEFGTSQASGDGGPYLEEAERWMNWMEENRISWINWSFADKAEVSAALAPGACGGDWNNTSQSGAFVKEHILNPADNFDCNGGENNENNAPVASISATPVSGTAPLEVNFSAEASADADGDPLNYTWNFGDGTRGTGVSTTHTYTTANTYTATLTVSDGRGGSDQAAVNITATAGGGDGGGDNSGECSFGTPRASALPSLNQSYNYVYVLGNGGPDLSNVSTFTINWDLQNRGLWQFSMNTNNGNPGWYVSLLSSVSHSFGQSQPSITINGSGISGFDGEYDVNLVDGNFVMVSTNGGYSIYFSQSATRPACASSSAMAQNGRDKEMLELAKEPEVRIFPNPFSDELTIELPDPENVVSITLINPQGKVVKKLNKSAVKSTVTINPKANATNGLYLIQVKDINGDNHNYKIMKN